MIKSESKRDKHIENQTKGRQICNEKDNEKTERNRHTDYQGV